MLAPADVATKVPEHKLADALPHKDSGPPQVGSPTSANPSSSTAMSFGRMGPICVLPSPFSAASGSTGPADDGAELMNQGSFATASSHDADSPGRRLARNSGSVSNKDVSAAAAAADAVAAADEPAAAAPQSAERPADQAMPDAEAQPEAEANCLAAAANLKRKYSWRPAIPLGRAGSAQRAASQKLLEQIVTETRGSEAHGALQSMAPELLHADMPGSGGAHRKVSRTGPLPTAGPRAGPSRLSGKAPSPVKPEPDVAAKAERSPEDRKPAAKPRVAVGASGQGARRVRQRRAETIEQMSARLEAMAAQQATLEATVVQVNAEKEALMRQVATMRERMAAAAAEAARLRQLRDEQLAAQQAQQAQHAQQLAAAQAAAAAQQAALAQQRQQQQQQQQAQPARTFTGLQTFNQVSSGVPGVAPPVHTVSINVCRPGVTVTSAVRPPPVSSGAPLPPQRGATPPLGPGVGPGPQPVGGTDGRGSAVPSPHAQHANAIRLRGQQGAAMPPPGAVPQGVDFAQVVRGGPPPNLDRASAPPSYQSGFINPSANPLNSASLPGVKMEPLTGGGPAPASQAGQPVVSSALAALHDLGPPPPETNDSLADPLDFLLTQMSLSLDELNIPELPPL